jgi:hypothetical protein
MFCKVRYYVNGHKQLNPYVDYADSPIFTGRPNDHWTSWRYRRREAKGETRMMLEIMLEVLVMCGRHMERSAWKFRKAVTFISRHWTMRHAMDLDNPNSKQASQQQPIHRT